MDPNIQNKDASIKNLIEYLADKYGKDNFKTKDYWDGDNLAIGLSDKSDKYLIYISTRGLDNSRYFVALENPSKDNELPYEPAGDFDNLQLPELERLFIEHLRIR